MALSPTDSPADVALSRWERVRSPALTIGGLAAATVALHVRDPHTRYSWGMCPSAALGLSCPGCGGLRAVNDLTHGDLAAAASSNLLLVGRDPVAVVVLGLWWAGRQLARHPGHDPVEAAEAAGPGCWRWWPSRWRATWPSGPGSHPEPDPSLR